MNMEKNRSAIVAQILREILRLDPTLGDEQIRLLSQQFLAGDEEALLFLFLEILRRVNQSTPSPSTPSGMIPPHLKASKPTGKKPRQKKKAGGQKGHPGHHRSQPDHIDRREEHRLDRCPNCGGPLQRCHGKQSVRIRIIEDLPAEAGPEVTEHIIHRDYCPRCQKPVEPPVADALTHSRIGHRLLVLTAYWHYALGMTLAQILETLNYHLHFPWSKGGMIRQWHALRQILLLWYETLIAEIRHSAVLHADETGWRVNGVTHWLWCFTTE
ncbi:MAG TPA: transposase [bacterium]|nr:transposase [bacterium]